MVRRRLFRSDLDRRRRRWFRRRKRNSKGRCSRYVHPKRRNSGLSGRGDTRSGRPVGFVQHRNGAQLKKLAVLKVCLSHLDAVDERAVGRAKIPNVKSSIRKNHFAMSPRDRGIIDDDVIAFAATEPVHPFLQRQLLRSRRRWVDNESRHRWK